MASGHAHLDLRVMKLFPCRFWEMPGHRRPTLHHLWWADAPLSREVHIHSGSDHPWPTWDSDTVQHWGHELSSTSNSTHYLPERDAHQCLQPHSAIQAEQAGSGKSLPDCRAQRKALPWRKTLLSNGHSFWRIKVLKWTILFQQCCEATANELSSCVVFFLHSYGRYNSTSNKSIDIVLAMKSQISQGLQ